MKTLLRLILLTWTASVCPAAEIVAWKVPLDYYAGGGLETKGVVRREAAPESSPFFKPGDELWDLKEVVPYALPGPKLSLDWLVWNATSAQLVAKGDWADLSAIHGLLRLGRRALQCRITMNVFQVPADKAPLGKGSKPLQSVSLVVKPGPRAKAEWAGDETMMKLDAEATVAESDPIVDLKLTGSAQVPDQFRMEVNTAVTLKSGEAKWIARDFDGVRGLDMELIASIETMEGVPVDDQVMIQRGNVPERLVAELKPPQRHRAGDGWLLICSLQRWMLSELTRPATEPEVDPFEDTGSESSVGLPRIPSVKPPEFLKEWLKNEVLDAKELLGNQVPEIKGSGNFAGYDPIRECFYFHSSDDQALDKVEALFTSVCICTPKTIIADLEGIGQTRLVGKSGQRASLSRLVGKKAIRRLLEIEPTIAENENVLDMRLHFEDETNPDQETNVDVATSLFAGKTKEMYSSSKGDSKTRLSLKADIDTMPRN